MRVNYNKYLKIKVYDKNIEEWNYCKFYEIDTLPLLGEDYNTGIDTIAVLPCRFPPHSGLERLEGCYHFYMIQLKDTALEPDEEGYIYYAYYYIKEM